MKTNLAFLLSLAVFNHASAALPFYDPFADATDSGGTGYNVGETLAGQSTAGNLWELIGSNFGTTQPMIAEGNLSTPSLPAPAGNSVSIVPAAEAGARLNLNATVTSGRAYYSFILKITNIDSLPGTPANNWFSGFGDGAGAQGAQLARIGAKLLTQRSGDGYVFGVGKTTDTSTFVYDSTVYHVDDVVFVVAAYEQLAGDSTNALVWINPPASSFGTDTAPAPTLSVSTVGTPQQGVLNANGVRAFVLACQNPDAPAAIIDELRIGTEWSSVAPLGDPAILENPISQTIPPGSDATFSVTASGTPALSYQWIKDGTTFLADDGNISGANTATLHVNSVSFADAGEYSVLVTNGLGDSVQSAAANLAISDPAITTQPQSRTNDFGTTATFTVVVSGTEPFTYQWQKEGIGNLADGGNISGSHTATLTLTGVAHDDAGSYSVTVGNSLGTADSAAAVLTVIDPVIVTQPMPATDLPGATVTFQVVADGTPPLTYQWRKDNEFIFDVGNLSGTSTDTLTVSDISATDEGNYSVAVIGSTVEFSADASLTVLSPVEITVQPVSRTVATGASVSFGVGATGTPPLSYQWFLDGTEIPDATLASYSLAGAQESGSYTVAVSNEVSSVTSEPGVLTVSMNLQLYHTNLVVVRVGDVAQTLTVNGNSIFLDQFDTDGNYVNTVNIPDDGPSAMVAIGWDNINGVNVGSTTGTSLTRSLDERFMVVAGYNTNRNYGAGLHTSVAAEVPRGVGLINSHAQYMLPVASTDPVFDSTFWRAAVTDGTNNFWGVGGIAGTYYFGFDEPPVLVQTTFVNSRSMGLFNGDIYCAQAANPRGVLKMDGMPTQPVTPPVLIDTSESAGVYDMAVSPDGNLIYLCDQRSLAANPPGGIRRYDFDGTNWNLTYILSSGFGNVGPRYIAADFSGPDPILYVTSNDLSFDNNRIIKFVDTGSASEGTTIAFAGLNQTFRGIEFGPVHSDPIITQPVLAVSLDGNNVILSWDGDFILQSATDVTGPYSDVDGATSPHTHSVGAATQQFFQLRD